MSQLSLLPESTTVRQPLVVAYGLGVDSTAVLVGYWLRGIRPDLIIFSDVGAEREATYAYLAVINAWLRSIGFPEVTVVRYRAKDFKDRPAYHTIEENCLNNIALPSIAYGTHTCSAKWKLQAQDKFIEAWQMAREAWSAGIRVKRVVGFEDSPHEHNRAKRCSTFAVQDFDAGKYETGFPLQEWGWNRERCIEEIAKAGLPVPPKSSCYFCTAMKPWEVDELTADKLKRIVLLEARTTPRHVEYAERRRSELTAIIADPTKTDEERKKATDALKRMPAAGKPMTEGLWRKAVKGHRGATPKPGAITEYIRQKGLLDSALIDAIAANTPTAIVTQADFDRDGIKDWQDWVGRIFAKAEQQVQGSGKRAA